MTVAKKIGIVCLVTRVCLTSAILVTKASVNPTNVPRQWHSYLPATSSPFAKHLNHQYDDRRAVSSDLKELSSSRALQAKRLVGLQSASTSSINRRQKSQTGPQRFPTEIHQDDVWLSAKVPNASPPPPSKTTTTVATTTTTTTSPTTLSGPRGIRENHRHVPRRFAYQDVEAVDRYLTHELNDDKLPYRGKVEEATYYHRDPQDITAVIKALDRFLSRTLNDDGYNSKVHPPLNPVLALVLSRYGRYVPGPRNPRVYAYLAANNIHNHQPFGKYKYEFDDEPIYTTTR
ncbi:PREDICTED: uncharacterized protein LOC105456526 [Wasmannia auropunctata]|uniref:uncharacterized protein LOC105456526 n=1 Tax=Wasmannia auropunctata TaxID=64793 RepID=UPI0005EDAE36|nr:PREDICTED: uncharacterized protein LOC105456526 [Wasmannia auropunctata]